MSMKKVFQRKETKYLLNQTQFSNFFKELQAYMSVDHYGLHTIRSLYYDTADYQFIRHSMEKPKYKEKFRVRSYGTPTLESTVFLEIKKKMNGIVYKRRIPIRYDEYLFWLRTGVLPDDLAQSQIGQEIAWLFAKHVDLAPKVLISYDRFSLFSEMAEEFRVTFDQNICYQEKNVNLDATRGRLIAPELYMLMEVKTMSAYPLWFVKLLTKHQIQKGSFSKYAQTYQRYLFKEELFHVI